MNKIAQYLNSNIDGEALATPMVRLAYSRDRSILRLIPNLVVFPRNTDDLRKVNKLSFQLSKKGKGLGLTARGNGHSQTGAAIGNNIVIDFNRHLNQIIDIDTNQGLLHVQAGADFAKISAVAKSHGLCLPFKAQGRQTIGGIIANNNASLDLTKVKNLAQTIDQLEVVLANGDVISVRRLNKRELDKKLGQSDFEGEIYRQIDKIIEENHSLIEKIDGSRNDSFGYHPIALVKQNDNSFDLTPLFIGSQGTLGMISEVILKLDILPGFTRSMAASFINVDDALDAQEEILKLNPNYCEIYHAGIFTNAIENGKTFAFYDQAFEAFSSAPATCLLADFQTKNQHGSKKIIKKITEIVEKNKGFVTFSDENNQAKFDLVRDVPLVFTNTERNLQNVSVLSSIQVPIFHFHDFVERLKNIEERLGISLPYFGSCTSGIINIQTELNLKSIGDKQKVFRLLSAFTKLAEDVDGIFCASEGEGRLKAPFASQIADTKIVKVFSKIRKAFNEQNTLNPGVKENPALRELTSATVSDYYNGIFY